MDWFKRRFPNRNEVLSVLGIVVFVVHTWSIREFIFRVPAFVLRYSAGEILAVFSYHMAFAFLESVMVCALLLAISAILPSSWIKNGFVYKSFVVILVVTIGAIFLQKSFNDGVLVINPSRTYLLFVYVGVALLLLVGLLASAQKIPGLQRLITMAVDQISVMLFVYLPLDVVSLVVVAIRLLR